jgi:hypothetical protein
MAMIPWRSGGTASDAINGLSQVHEAQKAAVEKPKLCVDCRHYWRVGLYPPLCARRPNLVSGGPGPTCSSERLSIGECKEVGVFWEPRPAAPARSWWIRGRLWSFAEPETGLLSRIKRWAGL